MLRPTIAADGLTGQPRGLQALLSPVLTRLTPPAILVSANPAQAKGSKCLEKTAWGRSGRPIMCNYVTHSRPHSTNPSPRRGRWTLPPALSVAKCESLLVRPSASAS